MSHGHTLEETPAHLGDQHNDSAFPFPTRSSHPLDQADGRFGNVVAHDQIDLANVQPFLADASGDQRVVATVSELFHHLDLLLLRQTLLAFDAGVTDELHHFDQRLEGAQAGGNFPNAVAVLAEDHDAGGLVFLGLKMIHHHVTQLFQFGVSEDEVGGVFRRRRRRQLGQKKVTGIQFVVGRIRLELGLHEGVDFVPNGNRGQIEPEFPVNEPRRVVFVIGLDGGVRVTDGFGQEVVKGSHAVLQQQLVRVVQRYGRGEVSLDEPALVSVQRGRRILPEFVPRLQQAELGVMARIGTVAAPTQRSFLRQSFDEHLQHGLVFGLDVGQLFAQWDHHFFDFPLKSQCQSCARRSYLSLTSKV